MQGGRRWKSSGCSSAEDVQADQEVSGTPHGGVQAFPVFKAAENMGQVDRPDGKFYRICKIKWQDMGLALQKLCKLSGR